MRDLDFINFGIKPDNKLLEEQIREVFYEIDSYGDLRYQAAVLFYGSISKAAKAFGITSKDLTKIIQLQSNTNTRSLNRRIEAEFINSNYDLWCDFREAAKFIKLLPHQQRFDLLNDASIVRRISFSSLLNTWKKDKSLNHISTAIDLAESYLRRWHQRKRPRLLFMGMRLEQHLPNRKKLEELSPTSHACSVATEIFREYDSYLYHWTETRKFMKEQRVYADSHKTQFIEQVVERDGSRLCALCGSNDRIVLDHIIPISQGGPSELKNFQLLCTPCNQNKAYNERAIIHGGRLRN